MNELTSKFSLYFLRQMAERTNQPVEVTLQQFSALWWFSQLFLLDCGLALTFTSHRR